MNIKQQQNIPSSISKQQNLQNTSNLQTTFTPQQYYQWYHMQTNQEQYYSPEQYYQLYYYQNYYNNNNLYAYQVNWHNFQTQITPPVKSQKLSRNQKKKIKKNKLKQELQQQRKQIGKWVELQRKDLLDEIKKIQQKQLQAKNKKKQKLSHLIEINKEIKKLIIKKNKNKVLNTKENVGNFRRKKKKPSHIKKMKSLYAELLLKSANQPLNTNNPSKKISVKNDSILPSNNDSDDFETQSQNEDQSEPLEKIEQQSEILQQRDKSLKQNNKQKLDIAKQQKKIISKQLIQQEKQVKIINYNKVGKLTGQIYNGIMLREWVDHMPSEKLQDSILRFINKLAYRQAVKKINQPTKARKLIISGLHECRRTLWTKLDNKRSKLLIVALNIERNNLERGTDDLIQQALSYANNASVPVVHISTRAKIGRAFTGKFGPRISMVSIVNFEGFQEHMDEILNEWKAMKDIYDNQMKGCFTL